MKIESIEYTWTDDELREFRGFEDQWYNECMAHGVPEKRAVEVGNRYNEQRESGTVAPKVVLDRYYLAIIREFETKKRNGL